MYSKSNNSSPDDRKTKWSRTEPIHDGEKNVKTVNRPEWTYKEAAPLRIRQQSKSNSSSPADRKTKWSRTEPIHDGGEHVKTDKPVIPAISACIIDTIFPIITWLDLDSLGQNNHQVIGPFYQSIASFH